MLPFQLVDKCNNIWFILNITNLYRAHPYVSRAKAGIPFNKVESARLFFLLFLITRAAWGPDTKR